MQAVNKFQKLVSSILIERQNRRRFKLSSSDQLCKISVNMR